MSEEQLVDAYLRGEVSRRTFIRRLVAAGLTLSAAVAYTHALKPAPAEANHTPGHLYDDPTTITEEAFVSGTTAMLTGTVRPNGKTTDYWFEYGTTSAFGTRAPQPPKRVSARIESESAVVRVGGLVRGQLYHYRLVAENEFGRSPGAERTFRAPAAEQTRQPDRGTPPPPPPPDATRPLVTIGAVSVPLEQLLRARKVQLMVGADEACTMLMELFYDPPRASRRRKKKIRVGLKRVRFSKPGAKNVKIKLSRKGRRALKGKNKAALRLVTTTKDASGNKVKKRRRLRFS